MTISYSPNDYIRMTNSYRIPITQGSPTPGPQTGIGPWPVRDQTAWREVSLG